MISLTIRSTQSEGEAMLHTRIKIGRDSKWLDLHLPVDIKKWKEVSTSQKKQNNYLDRLGHSKKIADIEFAIKDLRQRNCLTKEAIEEAIQNTVLVEKRERIKKSDELKRYVSDKKKKSVKIPFAIRMGKEARAQYIKILLPILVCEKNTGPGESILIAMAATSIIGDVKIIPASAPTISTNLLIILAPVLREIV